MTGTHAATIMVATAVVLAAMAGWAPSHAADPAESDRQAIRDTGPWPPPPMRDTSNRVSGKMAAIRVGFRLFFDARLSRGSEMSCATCHRPEQAFSDSLPVSQGRVALKRNAPGLNNVGLKRWFGWDGASDSLWAASIRVFLEPHEFDARPEHVATLLADDAELRAEFSAAFGDDPAERAGERALVNVAKALAAFQETLISPRSEFDAFRKGYLAGDSHEMKRYPVAARRGMALFFGSAGCVGCHAGPTFSNGGFADIGVSPQKGAEPDTGRQDGIARLQALAYSRAGAFNDDPADPRARETAELVATGADRGAFAVPALREVSRTAPYFHNGSAPTLAEAVTGHRQADAPALGAADVDALVAFLETL